MTTIVKPRPATPRSRSLAAVVGAVVFVVAYVLAVFLPGQQQVRQQRREIREKAQFIHKSANAADEAQELRQRSEQAQAVVETWRKNAPTGATQIQVLASCADLASESGVLLERLTPQEPTSLATLQIQNVAIEVAGPFASVMKFVAGLETRPETIWITKFQLEPGPEAGKDVHCGMTIAVFADNREKSG